MDRIIPWPLRTTESFRQAVRSLLSLTNVELSEVAKAVDTKDGFDLRNASFSELGGKLSTPRVDLAEILTASGFLYECMPEAEGANAQLVTELGELAEELGIEDFRSKEEALRRIFAAKPAYDRARKGQMIGRSVLPVLERISLQCDLRAVVEGAEGTTRGWVPTVIARLEFDEPVAGQRAVVFQLTEAGLDEVESELRAIRRTLDEAKKDLQDKMY